jgi:hypothetical protein
VTVPNADGPTTRPPYLSAPLEVKVEHKIAQRLLPAAEQLRAEGREPVLINRVVRQARG